METAVNKYLGFGRDGELERQFRAIRAAVRDVAAKRQAPVRAGRAVPPAASPTWSRSTKDAQCQRSDRPVANRRDRSRQPLSSIRDRNFGASGDPEAACSMRLKSRVSCAFDEAAERNGPDEAASELTTVYMTDFEPWSVTCSGAARKTVRPLEIQFNSLRGDLPRGSKGKKLTAGSTRLSTDVETLIDRLEAQPAGRSGRRSSLRSSRSCAKGSRSS